MPPTLPDPSSAQHPAEVLCDNCGYDIRSHSETAHCPECNFPVAESRRWANLPRRPAWRNSDPRWRRRILAGLWLLVFLPLMQFLQQFGFGEAIPVPVIFDYRGTVSALSHTLLCQLPIFEEVFFCMGLALLFYRERTPRRNLPGWTNRWGLLCTSVVLLFSAASHSLLISLVWTGIAAAFLSIPLKYQPEYTNLLVQVAPNILRYGPQVWPPGEVVWTIFSSTAVLLACVPLSNALRSTCPPSGKHTCLIPVALLAMFALYNIAMASAFWLGVSSATVTDIYRLRIYFDPTTPVSYFVYVFYGQIPLRIPSPTVQMELAKWLLVLAIAIWLTLAQAATWFRRTPSVKPPLPTTTPPP